MAHYLPQVGVDLNDPTVADAITDRFNAKAVRVDLNRRIFKKTESQTDRM